MGRHIQIKVQSTSAKLAQMLLIHLYGRGVPSLKLTLTFSYDTRGY